MLSNMKIIFPSNDILKCDLVYFLHKGYYLVNCNICLSQNKVSHSYELNIILLIPSNG